MKKRVSNLCLIIAVFIMSFAVGYKVLSWTGPTGTAPASNTAAPINVSSTAQTKSGNLSAAIFYDADDTAYYINPSNATSALLSGRVGIGTTATTYGTLYIKQSSDVDENGIGIINSGGGRSIRIWVDGSNNSSIDSGDGGNSPLTLNRGGGLVGIGTTSPAGNLDVQGSIYMQALRYDGTLFSATLDTALASIYCASENKRLGNVGYVQVVKQAAIETCTTTCTNDATYKTCISSMFWNPRYPDARVYVHDCAYASYRKYCCCR